MSRKWIRRKGAEWKTERTSPARALMAQREDEPCQCHFVGDTFDPRGCPAHDPEVRQPWA